MVPLSEEPTYETRWPAVWKAARRLLPQQVPPAVWAGLTGEVALKADADLLFEDVALGLLPGLAGLGLEGRLTVLPKPYTLAKLHRHLGQRPKVLLGFGMGTEPDPPLYPEEVQGSAETSHSPLPSADAPLLTQICLSKAPSAPMPEVQDVKGALDTAAFLLLLSLRRTTQKGRLSRHLQEALQRYAAFILAFPHRLPRATPHDLPIRYRAAAFLRELAGQKRHRMANRLRWAAQLLSEGHAEEEIDAAYTLIVEAACLSFHVPREVEMALALSAQSPLSQVQRHELIYLSRAGTPELRTLAAARLVREADLPQVQATLRALQFDPDPRVRAVVQRAIGKST
ncbi:MAG TPA: hypothetical protein VKV29_06255 [Chthonomonas sp.]|jgi:hypothetical protein|uniref:hypothetical protein n=1 Tax=Chthonomonas sp. TaxID=2282153 RepID=UPI002B4AF61D|nr:hypothetical protein [Chthonomonas sp.]HLH79871.1 hypothetical protein [Chthonomonas sp.]